MTSLRMKAAFLAATLVVLDGTSAAFSSVRMGPSVSVVNAFRRHAPNDGAGVSALLGTSYSVTTTHVEDTAVDASKQRSGASVQADGTLVIGAGLAGLAAAIALKNIAGVEDVRVIDRLSAEEFDDPLAGAGAQLGPNGLRALRILAGEKAVERVLAEGTKLEGNAIILPVSPSTEGNDGSTDTKGMKKMKVMVMPDTARADTGLPQVLIRWGVLRSILMDALPDKESIGTGLGGDIAGYQLKSDSSAVVPVNDQEGDVAISFLNEGHDPPLLVAADGARSAFRPLVSSSFTVLPNCPGGLAAAKGADLKYSGRVNIKAVAPMGLAQEFKPGHTYSWFSQGGGIACFAGPAGDGATYWAVSIADESDEETGQVRPFLNTVDFSNGSAAEDAKRALLDRLRNLSDPYPEMAFIVDLVEATDPARVLAQRSEESVIIGPSLSTDDGKVVLVGDAAHPMSPSYGQAANFALEDAAVLAVFVRDCDNLREALRQYEIERVDRCQEMQRRSKERAEKAMKGEKAEDVSKWIFDWDIC